jgi:ketohexokinase
MANILTVGIATLDIINEVESYPHEDDEIRALSQEQRRGGNASNTAVVLSQLGHQCYLAGTLVNETDTQTILNDLSTFNINIDYCDFFPQGKVPTSYIILNKSNGSRTIIHYRNLPEYSFTSFKKIDLSLFDWLHFEARNMTQTEQMMNYSKKNQPALPISLEIEKHRENIEQLLEIADYIIFSKYYAIQAGFISPQQLIKRMNEQFPQKTLICAWGDKGAIACKDNQIFHQAAFIPVKVIDTLGAGDVFNAGIIHQLLSYANVPDVLLFACRLAGKKCSAKGISNLMI